MGYKKLYQYIKKATKFVLFALIVAFLFDFFGAKGLIGFIIIILVFALFRLYQQREHFIQTLEYIECIIFGKPLKKDMWKKHELKKKKIKIVWGKK